MDIRIVDGRVIDPFVGLDKTGVVAVCNDHIVEDDGSPSALTLNAEGYIVVPGLVDFHTHVFEGNFLGIEPLLLVPTGVTAFVEAGSCGCAAFEFMREKTLLPCRLRTKAFLNVGTIGQIGGGITEDVNPKNYKRKEIAALVKKYPDDIIALKVRISKHIVGDLGLAPLDSTLELAESLNLPVCVHVTNPPVPMGEVAKRLRPGDIFCHVFQGTGYTIIGNDGKVDKELFKARERGVIFDAANGRMNFNFDVARAAIDQNFLPDIISSDVTKVTLNRSSEMKNLSFILSRYLNMGLDLSYLIRSAATTPAKLMRIEGKIGTLAPGAFADVAVFKLISQPTTFTDSSGVAMSGDKLLIPKVTILKGQVVYCASDFNMD